MFRLMSRSLPAARMPGMEVRMVTTAFSPTSGATDAAFDNAKPFEAIPGFRKLPFIGTAWIYFPFIGKYDSQKIHLADVDKYERFGDISKEKVGAITMVSVYNPEDVQHILQHEGPYPHRGELTSLKAYRELRKKWYKTPGVIILQGKEWHHLRSKTQPYIMKPKLVHSFMDAMQDISRDLVQSIKRIRDGNNEVKDMMPELYKWALESIACVSLDTRLGCLQPNLSPDSEALRMINAVQNMFRCMNKLEYVTGNIPFWRYFPTPTWNKFVKACDYHSELSLKYITRSMEALKNSNTEEKDLTLLQAMLSTKDLDLSGVMTTMTDLLFGGIDTTSHTQGFLMYHLAKNPKKQKKLQDEILKVLPSPGDKITPAVHNDLRYMKACIKESIRLHPIVRGIARRLDKDIIASGYRIPAGADIFCLLQTSHRMEKYFPKADQFIPERWLDKEDKPHPYVYLPFGVGRRSCIGRRLAEQEVMCAATEIFRNFNVEYTGEEFDLATRLINTPDRPLQFKFVNRI